MDLRPDPKRPYKAIIAALVAGAGVVVTAYADQVPTWLVIACAVVVAGGLTYQVPNPAA